jgi:tRNA A37 threonylcarbamoyladenosine dehydratase
MSAADNCRPARVVPPPEAVRMTEGRLAKPMFQRTELLLGPETMDALWKTRVILFGVGGVGSWCAEALVRSGIGHLAIVDSDCVCITNVNRQLQALPGTVGRIKVEVLAQRLRDISPAADIKVFPIAYDESTADSFDMQSYDYVLDAIDSLSHKLGLIRKALSLGCRLYSSMGASARLDPTKVRTGSLWKTRDCPLAMRVRKRLRRHGITTAITVVYSEELPRESMETSDCGTPACHCPRRAFSLDGEEVDAHEWCSSKKYINGSIMPVVATFGMSLSSLVIGDVVERCGGLPGGKR